MKCINLLAALLLILTMSCENLQQTDAQKDKLKSDLEQSEETSDAEDKAAFLANKFNTLATIVVNTDSLLKNPQMVVQNVIIYDNKQGINCAVTSEKVESLVFSDKKVRWEWTTSNSLNEHILLVDSIVVKDTSQAVLKKNKLIRKGNNQYIEGNTVNNRGGKELSQSYYVHFSVTDTLGNIYNFTLDPKLRMPQNR